MYLSFHHCPSGTCRTSVTPHPQPLLPREKGLNPSDNSPRQTPPMSVGHPFVDLGLSEVRIAVAEVVAMTDLQLGVRKITRSLAQRAGARLRMLETIVRRLIMLLALSLKLEASPPRPARKTAAAGPLAGLPEGTQLAVFPRAAVRRLALLPRKQAFTGSGPFPDSLRTSGPVFSDKLRDRVIALQRILAAPEAHAIRLARHLRRIRAAGEPKPYVAPMASAYRLRPELGALSVILPEQLNAAFELWDNSS